MSQWGDSYGSSLGESPAKPKPKRAPPSQRRHTIDDDEPSDSEDPILLTQNSSQPGSPTKPARDRRPDDDRPRAAAKNKQTASERDRVLKTQNGAKAQGTTAPLAPKGTTTVKKPAARVGNPYNTAFTSKPRGAASSAPTGAKAKQPAAKPLAASRTRSVVYDAEDEDGDVERTPKPCKKTDPFHKTKNMKTDPDASPSTSRLVLPFQAQLDKKKARVAAAAASASPSSPQPRPHPMAGMKPFKPAPAPASPKLAPFPLQHMIDANSNPSTSPKPAPFPLAGKQAKTSARDPHTPAVSKVAKKSIADKVLASQSAFDTPSPLRPELLSKVVAPFPLALDSPTTTSSSTSSKPKSSSSEAGVRPFPMKLPSKVSPKRPAEEGTESDRAPKRRKHVQEAPKSPVARPTITKSPGSPESPKQPAVDPSRLCPYCDELLPETRSPEFEELLRVARAKSWPKPRRTNPRGLKAPMTVFVSVCERHRFEAKVLPQAIRAGWPTTINFDSIPARVKRKRRILDDILKDPSTSSFFLEAMENVARVGARVAESAMGQYAIFERIQPGYYGERGAVVLHQTLFSLYTPEDLQKSHHLFAPLSTQTFQHSVLVPEAALALIMEDRGETRAQALKTMRASSRYGNLMFPDDDEADGVGEAMMRERARQRRIEIEKEEREEMEAERAAAEAEKKAKAKKSKSKATDTESQTDASTSRKKTTKSRTKAADDGMESCDSTATRRSARISRSTQRTAAAGDESGTDASTTSTRPARAVKTRAGSYLEVSDSDDDPVTLVAQKAKKPVARAAAQPAVSVDEPVKTKKKRVSPVIDSDDEPVVLSVQKAKKRSASPRASSRAPKKAATSRLSPTATATDSDSTALSDLSAHSRARRARKPSPVIDLTSDAEEASATSSSASRRSQAAKPPSTSSRGSTRNKYAFMDSSGSEDEAIPDIVMQGLQHQSPPLTQRPSSPQRRKVPSRASSRSRAAPADDDLQATPVARRQHTRWDDHGKASEATEEVTPRPTAMLRTSSYTSHRSSGSSSKGIFQPRSTDSWLLSTSSPSQKPTQAQQSPSRESNYEEDAEDFFNMTMELSD